MRRTRVIFIHGIGCSGADWSAQLEHLSQAADVIAPDLPGHGNPEPECHSLINGIATFVNATRESSRQMPTVLVGHSMGCRIALEAARRQPAGLVGVVLIEGSQRAIGRSQDAAQGELKKAASDNKAALMQSFLDMFSDATPNAFRTLALQRLRNMDQSFVVRLVEEMTRWDAAHAADALSNLQTPTLVIQSTFKAPGQRRRSIERDEMSPWLRLVSKHIPSAEIVWLTGLGHFPQIEAPKTINSLLANFIGGLE